MNPSPIISRRIAIAGHHPSSPSIQAFCTSCIRSLPRCSAASPTTVKIKSSPLLQCHTNNGTTTKPNPKINPNTNQNPFNNQIRWHGGPQVSKDAHSVTFTFTNPHPSSPTPSPPLTVRALVGETLLQTAQRNDVDLEGACEGVCACSTCHLVLQDDGYDTLLDGLEEDEEDMLDMANGLTDTSRLGCQVVVTEEMEGWVVEVPHSTRNFYVDGHIPQPH